MLFGVGVGVRLALLLQWPRRLNEDESIVGLMGLHVLRGEFPVFFEGQGYLGAVESYLTAAI